MSALWMVVEMVGMRVVPMVDPWVLSKVVALVVARAVQ